MTKAEVLQAMLSISATLCIVGSADARAYYVSQAHGDDTRDGTSFTKAWKSLDRVNSASLVAGDTVLFARGERWRGQLVPKSGQPNRPIVYGSYGIGDRPVLLGSVALGDQSRWVRESGNIWRYNEAFDRDVGSLIFKAGTGFGRKKMNSADMKTQGDFHYDRSARHVRLFSTTNPGSLYGDIEGAIRKNIIQIENGSHIVIDGLGLRYGAAHGIGCNNVEAITIRNCAISFIGGGDLYENGTERFGNGIEFWLNARRCVVEKNSIRDIFDTGVTNQGTSVCTHDSIVYRNNLVWNCGLASYECWSAAYGSTMRNVHFVNNTCAYAGYGWGGVDRSNAARIKAHVALMGTNASFLERVSIKNNIFYDAQDMLIFVVDPYANLDRVDFSNNCYYQKAGNTKLYIAWNNNEGRLAAEYPTTAFAQYQQKTGKDRESMVADPHFVGPTEFRLTTVSPCKNGGTNVGVTDDIDGNPRPAGSGFDIGCYETALTVGTGTSVVSYRSTIPRLSTATIVLSGMSKNAFLAHSSVGRYVDCRGAAAGLQRGSAAKCLVSLP